MARAHCKLIVVNIGNKQSLITAQHQQQQEELEKQ
jgi:hypothetical protein